jgi:Lon protease-like protein
MAGGLSFDQLPRALPIFPLAGVLLLPGGKLPLNIFEPRYLAMTRDAMAGNRMIGMIQPLDPQSRVKAPAIYMTGCAGRVTSFKETDDNRFLITLTGVCRFVVVEELGVTTPYRQVLASFARFRNDLAPAAEPEAVQRQRLLPALKAYLDMASIPADWKAIEKAPSDALVNSLAMICPFEPSEKQALLEAHDLAERSRVMTALIEMALLQRVGGPTGTSIQ